MRFSATIHMLMVGCATIAMPAFAQTTDTAPDDQVAEIVVTAQNRAQSVQDVPIAIDVIGAEAIKDAGVTDFREIERLAPAVNITQDANFTRVTVRGVGTNSNDESQDQSIAINIDGEYLNRANILNISLFDLDRVEVLRGPQGTLYGRSATGGAINFITRKANTRNFSANGSATYGNYDLKTLEGGVNVPFGFGGLRLSGIYTDRSGYFYHPNIDARSATAGTIGGRASVRLQPVDRLTIDAAVEYVDIDNIISSFASVDLNAAGNGPGANCSQNGWVDVAPLLAGGQCIPRNTNYLSRIDRKRYDAALTGVGRNQQQSTAVRGRIQYDFGPAILTYTGGYRDVAQKSEPAVPPSYRFLEFANNTATQSHELRLNGDTGGFIWQTGAFYYREKLDNNRGLFNPRIGPNGSFINYFTRASDTKSWAVFGQVDAPITDTLTAVGGVRYTNDKRNGVFGNYGFRFNSGPNRATTAPTQLLYPSSADDKITWLAGLNYKPNNDTLIYGKVSTGFKSGGFDSVGSYAPETNTAYEAGLKLDFMAGRRSHFNLAGFYYDYRNLQVPTLIDNAIGAQVFNAGGATVWGVEAETVINLDDRNTFSAAVNYLNTRYDELFTTLTVFCVDCTQTAVGDLDPSPTRIVPPNLAGNRLSQSPEWTISVGYDHVFDLGNTGRLTASAFSRFKSDYFVGNNYRDNRQEAYTQTDLSLKFQPVSERWSLQAFVRNLEDIRPLAFADFVSAGPDRVYNWGFGAPRTYGVRLGFDF